MLSNKINQLFEIIAQTKSLVLLYNDIQHQNSIYATHENLPSILAELELYKTLRLSSEKIMELQNLGKKYTNGHAFIYEPANGIIIDGLKIDFINKLMEGVSKKVHQEVQEKANKLLNNTASQGNIVEEAAQLVKKCQDAIKAIPNTNDLVLEEKITNLKNLVNLQQPDELSIRDLWNNLKNIVNDFPDKSKESNNNLSQVVDNLLLCIDRLEESCKSFRLTLEGKDLGYFQGLDYTTVSNNIINQAATVLEEAVELKKTLRSKAPSKIVGTIPVIEPQNLAIGLFKKLSQRPEHSTIATFPKEKEGLFRQALSELKNMANSNIPEHLRVEQTGTPLTKDAINKLLHNISYNGKPLSDYQL